MLQMALFRRWQQAIDLRLANSEALKKELESVGLKTDVVLWNAVPSRPARPPLAWPPTVAFVGRLVKEKGVDVLLQAFATVVNSLPQARLLIVGSGPEEQRLKASISEMGLSPAVAMVGSMSRDQAEERLAGAWVQAVPSRWAEPFGLVAAEAMMRGTAAIVTSGGGLEEIVEDGKTGLIVPPNDANTLATALLTLLQDRDLAEDMGSSGRTRARCHFGMETHIDRVEELYKSAIEASS
jgi:glycosyltransferase involved in cell wall biosynthesis